MVVTWAAVVAVWTLVAVHTIVVLVAVLVVVACVVVAVDTAVAFVVVHVYDADLVVAFVVRGVQIDAAAADA